MVWEQKNRLGGSPAWGKPFPAALTYNAPFLPRSDVTPARYWASSVGSTRVGMIGLTPKLWLKMNTSLLLGLEEDAPIASRKSCSVSAATLRTLNPFSRALGASPIP